MKATQLTKEDFLNKIANYEENPDEWKYKGKRPCIVDFYIDHSGPSKRIEPIIKELADEYEGRVDIYVVNAKTEEDLTSAFGIRTTPSFLFCPVNKKPKMAKGVMSKDDLRKAIEEVLLT